MEYQNIINSIQGINWINSSLSRNKGNLSQERMDTIVRNLGEMLKNIETHANKGFTPLTETQKPEIADTLQKLQKNLKSYTEGSQGSHHAKIMDLNDRIKKIEEAAKISSVFGEKITPPKIVPLAFFSDISCPDHNGSVPQSSLYCN